MNTQKLINPQVLADCPLQSQRVRNDYQKVSGLVSNVHKLCTLSTRLAARPIWDKTKNKYIRGCDAKMVEALWLAYSISMGQSERFLHLGERLGIPYCSIFLQMGNPLSFSSILCKNQLSWFLIKWFSAYAFHKMKDHLQGIVTLCL